MSELRDKIADQVLMHYEYRGDINYVAAEDRDSENYLYCQDAADAVLAVLADLPESVIERATEALRQDSYAVACPPWDSLSEEQKAGWLARGRLTLRAAFGGEQDD